MSSTLPRRPLFPPLPLDPISDNHPSEILSRDSSSSDSDSEFTAKRARMLKHAENYLRGEPLYLHSAKLRGPVVKNPWGKRGKQTKRKASGVEEVVGKSKRLKCGEEREEIEPTPTQDRGGITTHAGMDSRGTNTVSTPSTPSTPTPLRTRPPEATNVPDRYYSISHSPREVLELKTPVKKRPKSLIEVAPAFSPRTFYTKAKPQQPFTKAINHRRALGAKKSSPSQEVRGSAPKSGSARKITKDPEQIPQSSLEIRDSTPRLRSSRKSTKVPTPETPLQVGSSSSKPRLTRNSTKESKPVLETELPQAPHLVSRRRSPRKNTAPIKTIESQPLLERHGRGGQEEQEKGQEKGQEQEQEQERILDTIAVVHSPKPLLSDIDMKKKRPKVDFGVKSPIITIPGRLNIKDKRRCWGVGKTRTRMRRLEEVENLKKDVMSNTDIEGGTETEELQKEAVPGAEAESAQQLSATSVSEPEVSEPEHGREIVEETSNSPVPEAEQQDVNVVAVSEPKHAPESVEATSKESSTFVAVPEREQTLETSTSNDDPIKEQVLQSWVDRHVAASQSYRGDKTPINRLSIANLLSPVVESPTIRRNINTGTVNGVTDTTTNEKAVVMVPDTSSCIEGPFEILEASEVSKLPPLHQKSQTPPSSYAATINVPRSPDRSPQIILESAYTESPTQFDSTNPQSDTQFAAQQDSLQNTQYALLAAQKGFLDAIQESPVIFGPYLSAVTPGRDLLKPINFFENTQSETPGLMSSFGNGYGGGEESPAKTPVIEGIQWTTGIRGGEAEESPLRTSSNTLSSFKVTFGSDTSPGTTFTPFRAFATPESSPKATSQREFSPLTFSPLKQSTQTLSTGKKSVKFVNGSGSANELSLLDDDNEDQLGDRTTSFGSGFSPIGRVVEVEEQQGTEDLVGEVMGFMGGDVWDIDEELRKMAGSSATTTPSGKGERAKFESGRKRRALAKR